MDPTAGGAPDLLSFAFRLTNMGAHTWLGGLRDNSNPPLSGWSWVDGTPASNLNCGSKYAARV